MKYWLALFIIASALQPMQLQACDMEKPAETSHHASPMENSGHDCCDPDTDASLHACVDAVSCGSCSLALTVLPLDPATFEPVNGARFTIANEPGRTPPPTHPPYRPPIA